MPHILTRPVKIVVANTPGGPSDIVGRITAAALQQVDRQDIHH
jgi:tripartite-type tricarboxylate transporter receptor subunit TctC